MKYYKLLYKDGTSDIVKAKSDLDLIRTFDLATKKHIDTRISDITDSCEIALAKIGILK